MDANTTTRIAAKLAQAEKNIAATRTQAATMAAQDIAPRAEDWARYANQLAEVEGELHAWARIQMTVDYFARKEMELTDAALLDTIVELLSSGADDTWSGRTNDSQRARFDGIRKACSAAKYLVIAD